MSGNEDGLKSIVIDIGSGFTKIGFNDLDLTSKVIPTVYSVGKDGKKIYGYDAISHRKEACLLKLANREYVEDWDNIAAYWADCYRTECKTEPSSQPTYVGIHNSLKKGYKEKLVQVFLEELKSPGFYVSPNSLLSLYGSGKLVGVVVDVGEGSTTVSASHEGLLNEHQECSINLAGQDVNEVIKKALNHKIEDEEFIRNIKHNKCKIEADLYLKRNPDVNKMMEQEKDHSYTLPDGSSVTINSDIVTAPTILFNPSQIGKRYLGIHELVYECIMKADYESRRELYSNIVLAGGCFHTPGLATALSNQVNAMIPTVFRARFDETENYQSLTCMGGAIVSSMTTFQSNWITKQMLDEHGPSIVLRKCL